MAAAALDGTGTRRPVFSRADVAGQVAALLPANGLSAAEVVERVEQRVLLDSVDSNRLRDCWWLLANTGMRRGEALGLRWEDVDLGAGTLRIVRTLFTTDVERKGSPGMAWGTPKTAKGRRIVALDRRRWMSWGHTALASSRSAGLCAATTRTRTSWSGTWTARRSTRRGSAASSRRQPAGATLPPIRPHDLRHTHATLALRAGIHPRLVQERLGHANVCITLDTYSHVDLDMQAAAAARRTAALIHGQRCSPPASAT